MSNNMKDSGVNWIGEIPGHWEVKPLKQVLQERKEMNSPIKTDFILSLTMDKGVIPYSEKIGGGNKAKEDLSDYKLAYQNDIVLNSMNVVVGSVGLSKYFGCVSPVYYMLYTRNIENKIEYFNYVFQSSVFQKSLMGLGNGIMMKESSTGKLNTIRMRISMSKLNMVEIPVPSIEEQDRIVRYLDETVSKIDDIIEKTLETIENYKKYKQSIITEAVTKGLNKNVEMKISGIEFVEDIPKHWSVIPLKYLVDVNTQSLGDNTDSDYEFNYIEIGSVTFENGIEKTERIKFKNAPSRARRIVKKDDVIVSTVRTYLKAIATIPDISDTIVSTGFVVLTPKNVVAGYLGYYVKSNCFAELVSASSYGVSYPAISSSSLINFKIAIPSIDEQLEITRYLDGKCKQIENIIKQKEQLIVELEDFKKSLIYECVTGKKEI